MKPYPRNNIDPKYAPITPVYIKNTTQYQESRYSVYRVIDNEPKNSLEIKLTNSISQNKTFSGFYYTTIQNETLYSISKKYYNDEKYYWVLAKANGMKDGNLSIIPKGTTLVIPAFSELQNEGGYFSINANEQYE